MEDFEIGVYDSELYYSGKLKEWLELRTKQYKFYPNDHSTRYRFAEALIDNNKNKEALVYLKKFHDEDPTDSDFNQQIIDALLKLGKKKEDFNWKQIPQTFKLDDHLQVEIISIMKAKRKRKMKLDSVFIDLMSEVLEFNESELMNYLRTSDTLKIKGVEWYDAIIERIK